jgi:molecular chaperone DnaK
VEVKAIDGDGNLGGDDFDEILFEWAREEIRRQHGFDILLQPDVAQRVRESVSAAKCFLSQAQSQSIELPFLFQRDGSVIDVKLRLEREDFESLCDELFERLVPPIERALALANWGSGYAISEVDEILLVGGATRMPRVSKIVEDFFGKKPSHRVNPEEAVALGAAIQAGVLAGDVREMLLLDAIPFPIGIETQGGITTLLIDQNATLPTRKTEIFTTLQDGQTSVEVHVLRGGRKAADENQTLGRLILDGLPSVPRGTPQIEVTIDIDANSMVLVSAKDLGTGRSAELALRLM